MLASTSDHQTANRLSTEVSDYLHQHQSGKDLKDVTNVLTSNGLKQEALTKIEGLGFPKFDLSDTVKDTHSAAAAPREAQAQPEGAGQNPDQAKRPQTVDEILHEVHGVEDRYHGRDRADAGTQKDLVHALGDVQNFCKEHPDQAKALIKQLEASDLIGQLSIAAVHESVKGGSGESLTRENVLKLFDGQGDLGKAFQDHLAKAFSVTPGGQNFGTGYADAVRQTNGREYWGSPQVSGEIPVLTRNHLDDLMSRFDHGPAYHGESQLH